MKLIYIVNVRLPTEKAHGLQIMKMCEAFANQKIKVTLVTPRKRQINPDLKKIKDAFSYYGVKPVFTIKPLFCLDLVFLDKYLPHFVNIIPFFLQDITFSLRTLFHLLFKKYDLIYTRSPLVMTFTSLLKPQKLFFEIHEFPQKPTSIKIFIWFLKRIKGTIAITQSLKNNLQRSGQNKTPILVAPDGVGPEFFRKISQKETRKSLRIPPDKKIILYTGNLYEWKGVYTLAQAAKSLSQDCLVYFVGGSIVDRNIKPFKNFVKRLKLNNVVITGHVSPELIPNYLAAANVLVLPNSATEKISKYYTSPMKLFEYMSARRPIVTSDLPSLREILNNKNAIMVPPDNSQGLAQGIKTALKDSNLSARIAEKAYQEAKKFTWEKRTQKILTFFKS